MRLRLATLGFVTSLASTLTGCAASTASSTPWDPRVEAKDELLFALPTWCGRNMPRRPWTAWAEERDRAPTDRGICGVRGRRDTDDEGLCVEIEEGVVSRASMRREGPAVAISGLAGREAGPWIEARASGEPLYVRIEGAAIAIATHEGITRGPCFWR